MPIKRSFLIDVTFCRVNDCIVRINDNQDLNGLDRQQLLSALRQPNSGSNSMVNVVVRRRRHFLSRRYQAMLHLAPGEQHGLAFDLGVYVAR